MARGSCRRRSRIGLELYRLFRFHLEAKPRRDVNNSVYDAPKPLLCSTFRGV